jgi:hypothetical protein
MIKLNYLHRLLTVLIVTILWFVLFSPVFYISVDAQTPKAEVQKGLDATGFQAGSGPDVTGTITTVINVFSWVIGVAAVIMIMVGGFKYIISSGDSSNVTSAKNTILYAVIGLVVAAMAQLLVIFVLNRL